MKNVEIYTQAHCPFCHRAKALLDQKGVDYSEIDITSDHEKRAEMMQRSQRRTVPQIFIDQVHVGGSDDLTIANNNGSLDSMLALIGQKGTRENIAPELR